MTLNIYLNFGGNCREVFEFYRSVFGGEFEILQTFANGPGDMGVPEDEQDNDHARSRCRSVLAC